MVRIVKLTFQEEAVGTFLATFQQFRERIAASEGCEHLALLHDHSDARIFMTYSVWQDPKYLQAYRRSPLFKEVWGQVKPLFAEAPDAWSLDVEYESQ